MCLNKLGLFFLCKTGMHHLRGPNLIVGATTLHEILFGLVDGNSFPCLLMVGEDIVVLIESFALKEIQEIFPFYGD